MDFFKSLVKKLFLYQAQMVLLKYKPRIIAITGSVGKTLTREAIYLVISKRFFVRKSEKSFTAELGIPLTIIGCREGVNSTLQVIRNILWGFKLIFLRNSYPEYLILEIDGDKPGDIPFISSLIKIDILVMTAIGEVPVHVEAFKSTDEFFIEKRLLIDSVKRDGVVILNGDDEKTSNLMEGVEIKKVLCGIGKGENINGSDFKIIYKGKKESNVPQGMTFSIDYREKAYPMQINGSVGVQNEYACLLAFGVGVELGISPQSITTSLLRFESLPGRMNIILGIKNSIIIDDSYNSSPIAMSQALLILKDLKVAGRKIVVVGDMMELGKYSFDEHRKLALQINDTASKAIIVGLRSKKIAEELLNIGWDEKDIISVDDSIEAGKELEQLIEDGDAVLIKGSQAIRMEKVVEEVMQEPEKKDKLLVRQEEDWLNR